MTRPGSFIERRPWTGFLALALASIAAYLAVFGLIVSRPLTTSGDFGLSLKAKEAAARAAGPAKILLIAGSNGRYSHSCEVISAELGRPCVNMSITLRLSPEPIYDAALPSLGPGDLVYTPWEYELFAWGRRRIKYDLTNPWAFRHDRERLARLGPERFVAGAFGFDPRDLIESLFEMTIEAAGYRRRTDFSTLNAFGDETANTPQAAAAFAQAMATRRLDPLPAPVRGGAAERALKAFVEAAKARGAAVVGGLPATFVDQQGPPDLKEQMRATYQRAGAGFIALPNESRYPRALFFDTEYHLQGPAQAAHSRAIAQALRPYLPPQ